jgi:hypothetical protein
MLLLTGPPDRADKASPANPAASAALALHSTPSFTPKSRPNIRSAAGVTELTCPA